MRLPHLLLAATLVPVASAQNIRTTGKINETYAQLCASCHGKNLEGGQAPSMLDDVWTAGGDDESLFKSIRNGFPEKGMPPWGAMVPEKEIRAMVIYIHEQRALHKRTQAAAAKPPESFTAKSKLHGFRVATWIDGTIEPYGLAFLSADRAIVTEKRGYAYLVEKGKLAPRPILGLPVVDTTAQAGLYDVVPHPDFAKNGWIYFAFADLQRNEKGEAVSMTRLIRGKLSKDGALVDQETIYQAPSELYIKAGGVHFGGRIAFDGKGYLYLAIGERGQRDHAQELGRPNGKIHRLHDDGRVPADNPFAKDNKALATVWSYGHRNPQGLAIHPVTGQIFDAEHGPRGGDELNLVEKGKNYGWPVITYGMEYDGKATTDQTHKAGMEQPLTYWVPSIAPCGMSFYTGDKFPQWKNHLFLSSLAAQQLVRLELQGGKVVDQEVIFRDIGRIRHVTSGPDGALYVLLPTRIAKVTPAE
ncbi:MAG: PQQ-dependent sugar dehydrogenase [Opitutaceae bacterium]|nr:PQQ-dependent sugar dehydrogenase [Opitutaceae bacterium]